MSEGAIRIYYGEGHGKSTAAIGSAIREAALGRQVVVLQFLKGRNEAESRFVARLEPEIKFFNFAGSEVPFNELAEDRKDEERMNLRNGFNYGRKVITTGAADMIVLDELLGMDDLGVVTFDEIRNMLAMRPEEMTVIVTGRVMDERLRSLADEIYHLEPEK